MMRTNETVDRFNYYYHDVWEVYGDPRVSNMPLMNGGPWTVLAITAVYIIFVKYLGPAIMSKRAPYDLRSTIFWYNIALVILNGLFFIYSAMFTRFGIRTWQCNPIDPSQWDNEMKLKLSVAWIFVMSKFVDLLDTIFFVFRKKYNQVSALHVIHHSLVPINCWMGFKYVPSESAAFMPFLNSFVHMVMYTYYALSTLGPKVTPYLWWKKYLTQLQIIQIALVSIHCVYIAFLPSCKVPKFVFLIALPQALLVLAMFCSFFINSYLKPSPPSKSSISSSSTTTASSPSTAKAKSS
ncbi:elongation of very long chain fatty acids protein 1 [Tetranychus urticae]|nr:elongation of very long chain fatty acids protein 1 [Tetranychus urticae]